MMRKIIKIDQNKCNGCGLCINACHENAIEMLNGKAHLIREDYCDGLGDCLPQCPCNAISFELREALSYDRQAVLANMQSQNQKKDKKNNCLLQWPCQIKLMPLKADYYQNADLLIAADCTAYAYANIHEDYMKGKITLIGCPKLDQVDYSEKLLTIFQNNDIRSVTILRMDVACCSKLETAVKKAIQSSQKAISVQMDIVLADGTIKK